MEYEQLILASYAQIVVLAWNIDLLPAKSVANLKNECFSLQSYSLELKQKYLYITILNFLASSSKHYLDGQNQLFEKQVDKRRWEENQLDYWNFHVIYNRLDRYNKLYVWEKEKCEEKGNKRTERYKTGYYYFININIYLFNND